MKLILAFFIWQGAVTGDSLEIEKLNYQSYILREINVDSSQALASKALELANLSDYTKGIIDANNNLAWSNYRKNEYSKALNYAHQALIISEQKNYIRGRVLGYLAIAACYFDLEQPEEAKKHVQQAIKIGNQSKDQFLQSRLMCAFGIALYGMDKFDSAEYISRKSIEFSKSINDQEMVAFAYRNLGDVRGEQKLFDKALEFYLHAYEIADRIQNHYLVASLGHRIGKSLVYYKKFNEAYPKLNASLTLSQKHHYKDEYYFTCLVLEDYYVQRKEYQKAFQFADQARLSNTELSAQMTLLYGKLERQHNQHQLELLKTDAALTQEKMRSQKILLITSSVGITSFALMALALLRTNKQIKKTNDRLRENEKELSKLNRNKDSLFSIISHDLRGPVSSLRGITELMSNQVLTPAQVQMVGKELNYKVGLVEDHLLAVLHWSNAQLNEIAPQKREFSVNLCINEILPLYKELANAKSITIQSDLASGTSAFADESQVCIIIRNLLSNAIKFTNTGGKIEISTRDIDSKIEVTVKDNGRGMNSEQLNSILSKEGISSTYGTKNEKGFGIGLRLCAHFIQLNNGQWNIQSEPTQGTCFIITLPSEA